jgi:hypothetical protein
LLLTRKLLNQRFLLMKLKSSLRKFYGRHHDFVGRCWISVTNDHGPVPLVVNVSQSFPHSWLITGFVTRLTRRVSLVEQALLILLGHMSSPPVFSGDRVTRSLVLHVCFVDRCLSLCPFSFTIVLSVLLRCADSDYPCGNFKHFFLQYKIFLLLLLFY